MAITVDWGQKIINVPKADTVLIQSSPNEIRELNLNTFRLWLKDLEDDYTGMVYPDTHAHVAPITVGGVQLARVIEIINDYTVTFEDGQYAVNLVGANSNVADRLNVNQVSVRSANSAGLVQTREIEHASYLGGVTYNKDSGFSGTAYPVGTPTMPVNNIEDMLFIANLRGFDTCFVHGEFRTNSSHFINNMRFIGRNAWNDHMHTFAGGTLTDCYFENLHISGPQYGTAILRGCRCGSVSQFSGEMVDCILENGTTTLSATGIGFFVDCVTGSSAANPRIDHNGTGQVLMRNHNGPIDIQNKTGGADSSLDFSSGYVNILSSCTGGTIKIRGVSGISNQANGTKIVTNALISQTVDNLNHTIETWRDTHQGFGLKFYVDPVYGLDTNAGDSKDSAFKTVQAAINTAVDGRGDTIYLLAPDAGAVTINERITLNKEDLHIRGPGRGIQFQPSTPNLGTVITVSSNNCSLSGFLVRAAAGSTTDNCIDITGKFAKLNKLYLVGTLTGSGDGICIKAGDYHELINVESEKMGGSGVHLQDDETANGSPREVSIIGGNYYLNNKDGICCTGTPNNPTNSTRIIRVLGANIHDNLQYGLSIDANTTKVVVDSKTIFHGNILGSVNNNGPSTYLENAERDESLVSAIWSNIKALSIAKYLGLK